MQISIRERTCNLLFYLINIKYSLQKNDRHDRPTDSRGLARLKMIDFVYTQMIDQHKTEVKEVELRPYQQDLINRTRQQITQGKKSICVVLGCGGGKSVIQGMIAASATAKGNRVLFIVHRKELCEQITDTFRMCGVDFDLCSVEMVGTVSRRLDKIPTPAIIITDEAHHSLAATYRKIYDKFPDAIRLGFTATPCRLGSGGLGEIFDSLIEGVSTKWLIDSHYLAPYKYYSIKLADVKGVRVTHGEYNQSDIAQLMEKNMIYGSTVDEYIRLANGKRTIVYCASIKASKHTAAEFSARGIAAEHLDGETDKNRRANIIGQFRAGQITVLCNVDLFGEGFDVPDCECVMLVRPTKSLTLYIQQSMRSMRYKPDKTAIIIDLVANVYTHGLPDEPREWTLKAKRHTAQNKVTVRQCPVCFCVLPSTSKICSECGYEFQKQERAEAEQLDMEMKELTPEEILKAKPYDYYKDISTFDEMKRFQRAKGYKFAWVIHKCVELGISIPDKYNNMRRIMGV